MTPRKAFWGKKLSSIWTKTTLSRDVYSIPPHSLELDANTVSVMADGLFASKYSWIILYVIRMMGSNAACTMQRNYNIYINVIYCGFQFLLSWLALIQNDGLRNEQEQECFLQTKALFTFLLLLLLLLLLVFLLFPVIQSKYAYLNMNENVP